MAVKEDIEEIRTALGVVENEPSPRNLRRLHNILAAKMAANKDRLGLTDSDVEGFGGGVPKPDE